MGKALSKLGALIEKKASERLESDIRHLHATIHESFFWPLLRNLFIQTGAAEDEKRIVYLQDIYDNERGRLHDEIFRKNIDRYINEETDMFFNKINE